VENAGQSLRGIRGEVPRAQETFNERIRKAQDENIKLCLRSRWRHGSYGRPGTSKLLLLSASFLASALKPGQYEFRLKGVDAAERRWYAFAAKGKRRKESA
jgi:hypothetical protein